MFRNFSVGPTVVFEYLFGSCIEVFSNNAGSSLGVRPIGYKRGRLPERTRIYQYQGWAREVKARDRDETFVALET